MKTLFALSFLLLVACGGGSGDANVDVVIPPAPPVVEPPPPTPEPEEPEHPEAGIVLEAYCDGTNFVTVETDGEGGSRAITEKDALTCGYMPECPVDFSGDNSEYPFVNCNGITQSVDTPFRYTDESTFVFTIDVLFVVDSRLDTRGKTIEEFVQTEVDYANSVFANSGVYLELAIADIKTVETTDRGLRRQVEYFTTDSSEYANVTQWQKESNADLAHLFIEKPDSPMSCGAAYINSSSQTIQQRRGVTQCFQGDVFQEFEYLRYYNRANETFVHEIGHNLGLEHDQKNANGRGIFPFSFGYVLEGTTDVIDGLRYNGIGTIMSYADDPTQSFSDPNAYFVLEDGTTVSTGNTDTSCFGLDCEPKKLTNAVKHLNIVRHEMSLLDQSAEAFEFQVRPPQRTNEICLF